MSVAMPFTKFDAPLLVVPDAGASHKFKKEMYRVTKPFRYYVGELNSDMWVDVPAGFLTDGASVPKFLHWLIKPWGKHGQAAVLHDILCLLPYANTPVGQVFVSYNKVHKIFKEALKVTGNSDAKVWAMYWAVRAYFYVNGYKADPKLINYNQRKLSEYMLEQTA